MAEKRYIRVERRGAVAEIVFNRPEKKNALSRDAIREISGDDPGPDPKQWKEWLEKRNQSKTPKDKATPETGKKDTKDKN